MENYDSELWVEIPRETPKAIIMHMGRHALNLNWDNTLILDFAEKYRYMRHIFVMFDATFDNIEAQEEYGDTKHLFFPQRIVEKFVAADFPTLYRPEPQSEIVNVWAWEMDDRLGKGLKKREQNPDIDKDI